MIEKILISVYCIVVIGIFSMNIWGNRANIWYENYKDFRPMWFWFRVFKIPQTKENFIKFVKIISMIPISGLGLVLIYGFIHKILTILR